MSADIWKFWRDALSGADVIIEEGAPQCGFYKMRKGKDGPWLPVMIRMDGDEMRCRVGSDSGVHPSDVWLWCAKHPISKEDAKHAFDTGAFPGDAPAIGDNSGAMSLADQIKDYAQQALDWLRKSGVKDDRTKDMAANFRAELIRLSKEADTQREAEKRPHDDAAKAIQAKWKPLIDTSKNAADESRDALTAFMTAEKRRLEAEQRAKYEAEQKAAAAARAEIEAQHAKQMRDDPIAALTSPEPELPMAPPPPEPIKVQAGGQRGRKTGLREVTRYVVTDHKAALAFFADSEDVRELVAKLAERASKAGVAVPGVEKRIEEVAA